MTKRLEDDFADADDVVIFHLQTVFEGAHTNTPKRGPREAAEFGIQVPVGYDVRLDGSRLPLFMTTYGSGGTPWTTVIDKEGVVRVNAFTPGYEELASKIRELRQD